MTTAHWVKANFSNLVTTNQSGAPLTVSLPAKSTLQRVVFNCVVAGAVASNNVDTWKSYQGLYMKNDFYVTPFGGAQHLLYTSWNLVPVQWTSMFDSTQVPPPVGNNRLFYGLYAGGDRELGLNLKTSYGGPAQLQTMQVNTANGFYQVLNGTLNNFQLFCTAQLRALYYTTP